jgi:hypothetical protein
LHQVVMRFVHSDNVVIFEKYIYILHSMIYEVDLCFKKLILLLIIRKLQILDISDIIIDCPRYFLVQVEISPQETR